jgi:hypothetical protein
MGFISWTPGSDLVKKLLLISAFTLALFLVSSDHAFAMMHGQGHRGPYGGYCRGPKWGWYGARRHVKTVEEVRELLTEFLKDTPFAVGEIYDRESYFEVEIQSEDGSEIVDILIVDKRTCRIRSKY